MKTMEFPKSSNEEKNCCETGNSCCPEQSAPRPPGVPMAVVESDEPCCGAPPGPPFNPNARPGYEICHYVKDFHDTPAGPVPQVSTSLSGCDILGATRARLGISRDSYRVSPGLYCVNKPDNGSPVLVSANYKLSFDALRKELDGIDAWILVLDTRGINVWCAAGKNTFSTEEVIRQVERTNLSQVVEHRKLVVPQLGAPGVAAHKVRKGCGFEIKWGPVRASDLGRFLADGMKASLSMRQPTFTTYDRSVLIPVELSLIVGPTLAILAALFVLSGINSSIFSLHQAWTRGVIAAVAYGTGVFAGAVAVPILLPWLPGRQFYWKGILAGLVCGVAVTMNFQPMGRLEMLALVLFSMASSSYAAMNFTGATPYTSPSGVEKEMKQGIPVQIIFVLVALVSWIAAPFLN